MADVHPDHAALIADLRDNARALGFSLVLSANFIEYQVDLNDRAADALASAPSPRTPLPEDKMVPLDLYTQAIVDDALATPTPENIERLASELRWWFSTGSLWCEQAGEYARQRDALAAAPKVEQRTPTQTMDFRSAYLWASALRSSTSITEAKVLWDRCFSSPEAPESKAR